MSKHSTVGATLPPTQTSSRYNKAFYIQLNKEKKTEQWEAYSLLTHEPINKQNIDGIYAFCLVEHQISDSNDKKQSIMLNPLKEYESNHGLFSLFVKRLPLAPNQIKATIIAGGEIAFENGDLTHWNLKSAAFSKHSPFDEANALFKSNLLTIMIPSDLYIYLKDISSVQERSNPDGSWSDPQNSTSAKQANPNSNTLSNPNIFFNSHSNSQQSRSPADILSKKFSEEEQVIPHPTNTPD